MLLLLSKFYTRQNKIITHFHSYIINIFLGKAFDSIFKKPESIFIKTTVRDLFFHGIPFDCTDVKDFAGSAVCSALQEREQILIREGGLRYRFGYLAKVMHLHYLQISRFSCTIAILIILLIKMKKRSALLPSKTSVLHEIFE